MSSAETGQTGEQQCSTLRGARVLLVEDNDMNRGLATDLLVSAGIRVESAKDGQEASMPFLATALPGIDTVRGLRNCAGRASLYQRTLGLFTAGTRQFEADFRAAAAQGDLVTMHRLAHTLKSNSGTIGAVQVEINAGRLETLCANHGDRAGIHSVLEVLLLDLNQVLASLASLQVSQAIEPAAAKPSASESALAGRLADLRTLVNEFDPQAAVVAEELLAELGEDPRRPHLMALHAALSTYDFEAAQALAGWQH